MLRERNSSKHRKNGYCSPWRREAFTCVAVDEFEKIVKFSLVLDEKASVVERADEVMPYDEVARRVPV